MFTNMPVYGACYLDKIRLKRDLFFSTPRQLTSEKASRSLLCAPLGKVRPDF